ncbi:MAG: hypothetical protein MPJ24_09615 [Pirellulaceae bacterium]|nr:hypothetical protein [Pirellulaceae bacterium]
MANFTLVLVHSDSALRIPLSKAARSELPSDCTIYSFNGENFFQPKDWCYPYSDEDQERLKKTKFDLAVAHAGDLKEAASLISDQSVYFGGSGESGDRRVEGKEYIYRPIYHALRQSKLEPLGIFEPLKEWCSDPDNRRPSFLDPPESLPEPIIVLTYLCQGFLANYALQNINSSGEVDTASDPAIKLALYQMGWITNDEAHKVNKEVSDLALAPIDTDSTVCFWTEPFKGDGKMLRQHIANDLPESSLPDNVEKLLNSIENDTVPKVELVAKAFTELNSKLKSMECEG